MDVSTFRRTVPLVASAVLITALTVGAYAAPATAAPDEQKAAARAEAKAAREAARQARAETRADAKAAREAAKQARAEARADAKAARKAAKLERSEKVTVCHKPGTPAEGTLEISVSALQAHLDHGDTEEVEACGSAAPAASSTCQELGTSDTDTSPVTATEEDDTDDILCEEPQPVLVSIDAPESVDAQELLQLQGAVSGLEADDIDYVWSSTCLTDEELADPAVIASEPGTALLVIREDSLSPGTTCDFTLTVKDEAEVEVGSATVTVEVLALS
jgi:hypothetical protein